MDEEVDELILYPAEFVLDLLEGKISFSTSNFDILFITGLTNHMQIPITCVLLLVIDVRHHFISDVANALHVLGCSSNTCESEVERVFVKLLLVIELLLEQTSCSDVAFEDSDLPGQ